MVCCFFSDEPLGPDEKVSKFGYRATGSKFQTGMMSAPCESCPSTCCWFTGQFFPLTCGCTQYYLRKKILDGKMENYRCFQGQFTVCCCIKAGSCGEESCPELCLCCEAHLCNGPAVSASRAVVMDRHDLMSDPCDNRLIRCNNCLQLFSCFCHVLAVFEPKLRELSQILDIIADVFFHTISGCMTAQVAYELDYRKENGMSGGVNSSIAVAYQEPIMAGQHGQQYNQGYGQGQGTGIGPGTGYGQGQGSLDSRYDKYGNPKY